MSVRSIREVIPQNTRPQFEGEKVKLADLKDREIIIKDFVELESKLPGQTGNTYLLESAENAGLPIIFSTSSKVIKDLLAKAKSNLPVKATVRNIKSKSGPYSYWSLE